MTRARKFVEALNDRVLLPRPRYKTAREQFQAIMEIAEIPAEQCGNAKSYAIHLNAIARQAKDALQGGAV